MRARAPERGTRQRQLRGSLFAERSNAPPPASQDDFAIAVNEVRKLVNESGNQSKIISETLKALSEEFDFQVGMLKNES